MSQNVDKNLDSISTSYNDGGSRVRQKTNRVTRRLALRLTTFFVFGLVIATGFQNCAGYEAANNPLFDASSVVCIGLACGVNAELIGVSIASEGMIYVRTPNAQPAFGDCSSTTNSLYNADSNCFDVTGYCEAGGFEGSQIWAELKGSTPVTAYNTGTTCENGRYRFLFKLPAGYNYGAISTLRVTIFGIDSNQAQISNPSGANWQEVGISGYTQQN